MPIDDVTLSGSFSKETGTISQVGDAYPDIISLYTAPDNESTRKVQIRVTNELEIGVTRQSVLQINQNQKKCANPLI